jgi:hypothetical protein
MGAFAVDSFFTRFCNAALASPVSVRNAVPGKEQRPARLSPQIGNRLASLSWSGADWTSKFHIFCIFADGKARDGTHFVQLTAPQER